MTGTLELSEDSLLTKIYLWSFVLVGLVLSTALAVVTWEITNGTGVIFPDTLINQISVSGGFYLGIILALGIFWFLYVVCPTPEPARPGIKRFLRNMVATIFALWLVATYWRAAAVWNGAVLHELPTGPITYGGLFLYLWNGVGWLTSATFLLPALNLFMLLVICEFLMKPYTVNREFWDMYFFAALIITSITSSTLIMRAILVTPLLRIIAITLLVLVMLVFTWLYTKRRKKVRKT